MRLAVLADTHGNRWALEAVLEDLDRGQAPDMVLDLGDLFYGPLDPAGTAELLLARRFPTVRGNQDRIILDPSPEEAGSDTWHFVRESLPEEAFDWLKSLPSTLTPAPGVLACHGTPQHDDQYLLEIVTPTGAQRRPVADVAADLPSGHRLVLCGHSHEPKAVAVGTTLVLNPGSVGLPAYRDELPYPHSMMAGSPHARYALVELDDDGIRFEHRAVPYDVNSAVVAALTRGAKGWAACLATGLT